MHHAVEFTLIAIFPERSVLLFEKSKVFVESKCLKNKENVPQTNWEGQGGKAPLLAESVAEAGQYKF